MVGIIDRIKNHLPSEDDDSTKTATPLIDDSDNSEKGVSFAQKQNPKSPEEDEDDAKKRKYILIGVFALVIFLLLFLIFGAIKIASSPKSTEATQTQKIEQTEQSEQEAADGAKQKQDEFVDVVAPTTIVNVSANDFVVAEDPVEALVDQSFDRAITETIFYKAGNGAILSYPDGSVLPLTDSYVAAATSRAKTAFSEYITTNGLLDKRYSNGRSDWYIQNEEGQYVHRNDIKASGNLRKASREMAINLLNQELGNAITQAAYVPESEVVVEKIVEEKIVDLSAEQVAKYQEMLKRYDSRNSNLTEKVLELKDQNSKLEGELRQALQRLEDSPTAGSVMKTISAKSLGWEVVSVAGDKVWLKSTSSDEVIVLFKGDSLPDNDNIIIANNGASSGAVFVKVR